MKKQITNTPTRITPTSKPKLCQMIRDIDWDTSNLSLNEKAVHLVDNFVECVKKLKKTNKAKQTTTISTQP